MTITNALASVPVKDLSSAVRWYQILFGRPPDSRHGPDVVGWNFEQGGGLQIYKSPERAGYGSLTLVVTSIAEQTADLRKLGIDTGPQMITDSVRVVMIKDHDGNSIAFAETIDRLVD